MYKCNSCGKGFFFEGQLKRHILFNHPQAEQPSSLFTEIEEAVRAGIVDVIPTATTSRMNRPTVHQNPTPYVGYPTLESLQIREQSAEEDLCNEWYSAVQITPPTWIANPSSW